MLILDEVGYLPIDKAGADLMFQVLAARYEKASTILTTNRAYKNWPEIFNNDATLTAALLDRLVHHVSTIVIEGRSYRTREQRGALSAGGCQGTTPPERCPSGVFRWEAGCGFQTGNFRCASRRR